MEKNKLILIVVVAFALVSLGAYFFISSKNNSYSSKTIPNESTILADCIITVRGEKYNVKEFRNMHKGGDIFKCDTDMTEAFNNQHGDRELQKMQKYLVK